MNGNNTWVVGMELGDRASVACGQMIVAFHEGESDAANPFVQKYELLARPSHLKLTHSTGDEFWWNTVSAGQGGGTRPRASRPS